MQLIVYHWLVIGLYAETLRLPPPSLKYASATFCAKEQLVEPLTEMVDEHSVLPAGAR